METHPQRHLPARLVLAARTLWRHLPDAVLESRPMRRFGAAIYDRYVRETDRSQSHYTWFLRNPPQLELLRDLLHARASPDRPLRIASIGCSVGAELYSLLWMLRRARPDLPVAANGVDIVADAVEIARKGVYRINAPSSAGGTLETAGGKVLSTSPEAVAEMFDVREDGAYRIKDWIGEGAAWRVGDAADERLRTLLGPQDAVLACNFLGPMEAGLAERCLRNLATLLAPGGYLVLDGVDLDLKTRVVPTLGLVPVAKDARRIHRADPTKQDWPWTRWSLEPFDGSRPDWEVRYSTIFVAPQATAAAADKPNCPPAPAKRAFG
jgi:chemotaxis methyl-accepting protein methylase